MPRLQTPKSKSGRERWQAGEAFALDLGFERRFFRLRRLGDKIFDHAGCRLHHALDPKIQGGSDGAAMIWVFYDGITDEEFELAHAARNVRGGMEHLAEHGCEIV